MTIRRMSLIVVAVLVASGCLMSSFAFLERQRVFNLHRDWLLDQEANSHRSEVLREVREAIGYGGMIHQFKNYVLRQDAPRARAVESAVSVALRELEGYDYLNTTEAERNAVEAVRDVVLAYRSQIGTAVAMVAEGATIEEIDQAVAIDDAPALNALAMLAEVVRANRTDPDVVARSDVLGHLRDAMGFGGFIHQFKNLVIRRDPDRIARVEAARNEIDRVLGAYRSLDLTEEEVTALDTIERVVESYMHAIETVHAMIAEDRSAHEIDAAVRIDDGPALEALAALERADVNAGRQLTDQIGRAIDHIRNTMTWMSMAIGATSVMLIVLVTWILRRRIVRPIDQLTRSMRKLAQDGISPDADANDEAVARRAHQDDEIGRMAAALEVFRANTTRMRVLQAEAEKAEEIAAAQRQETIQTMVSAVEREMEQALNAVMGHAAAMDRTVEEMGGRADRMANSADGAAAAASQALSNAETVAAAAEQLSASIGEIGRQVTHSTTVTNRSVTLAAEAQTIVGGLSETAGKIGTVVELISRIAEQTNLLALNATIEAARAGEAGKGFAVVASEVKNLANQTARSTEEISQQVEAVQAISAQVATAIESVAETIGDVGASATTIAAAVEQQSASTQEISRTIEQSADTSRETTERMSEVLGEVRESATLSTRVKAASGDVNREVERLSAAVTGIVRAATEDVDHRDTALSA